MVLRRLRAAVTRAALAAALAGALAGCPHAAPAPPGPPPVVGGVKQVAPLAIGADAKPPTQALILGTDVHGGSTVVPLAGAESRVTVDSMWIRLGDGPAQGGSSPVTLVTAPNPDHQVRVGVFEETAGGLGPQWRAGVWLASLVAATVLDKDLTDFKFSAEAGGQVDGASASALMTAGYLASMLGQAVDPSVTMTGIINPDGTIGPVAGIPEKFAGAIASGKKRLGYPIGMRRAPDAAGESVDLVALARAAGAEAVEVSDVYAALELLTGKSLPRPVPVDPADMALEPAVAAALDQAYAGWQTRVAGEWARLLELDQSGRLPAGLARLASLAHHEGARAEKLRGDGEPASAYRHVVRAWVLAAAANATAEVLDRVRANDLAGARARLDDLAGLATTTEVALGTIGAVEPTTMADHLRMMSAFQRAIAGWGFHGFAHQLLIPASRATLDGLAGLPAAELRGRAVADQVVAATAPTALAIARAVAASAGAVEALELERTTSLDYLCSLPNVRRQAASFQSAAQANLAYFESLVLTRLADEVGVPLDQARVRLAGFEPDYLVAVMAARLAARGSTPQALQAAWGDDSIAWGLFTLAGGELSFFRTSMLISRWYSLGVELDPLTGQPTRVERRRAFGHMLAFADKRARENARAARIATGAIPVQARLRYQQARVLRDGDLADQLAALEALWASSGFSQTAVMLARDPAVPPGPPPAQAVQRAR